MSFKVLAKEGLSATAIEAFSTQLRVVGTDSIANDKRFDALSDGGNDANSLMAWEKSESICGDGVLERTGDKRKLGSMLASETQHRESLNKPSQ